MSADSVSSQRGRPMIQDQWTKVIHIKSDILQKVSTHIIASDLLLDNNMPDVSRKERIKQDWTMYFNPSEYWENHPGLTLDNCKLTQKKLQQYGKQLTLERDKL